MPFFRRISPRSRLRRGYLRFGLLMLVITFTIDAFRVIYPHSSELARRVHASPRRLTSERIYIASIHWNNEAILRSHWNSAVVNLTKALGTDNVFVSVLESGSWDNTKAALRDLDAQLDEIGVWRNIVLEDSTHKELIEQVPQPGEEGWVWTPRQRKELRRIPYLAKLRNRVMEEMLTLKEEDGISFNKVLWLNDVVFTVDDVLTLLDTNAGTYASACSLDFSKPPAYYDTFALRDSMGAQPISPTWPYFLSGASLAALVSGSPIPVQSCWNGIVAMDAAPFYPNGHAALRFRGIADDLAASHLEASECCLIHTDNPLSYSEGVFVNPNVRVGYNAAAYEAVSAELHPWWPSASERIRGMWYLRWKKLVGFPKRMSESVVVNGRVKKWRAARAEAGAEEDMGRGEICLINEMQVLVENGWKHL